MNRHHDHESCPYCHGNGYFHLVLGGTESCPNCEGAGTVAANGAEAEVASTSL